MSAAPLPSDPESAEEADAGWALLDGLRRRLDDQAAQARKTSTQVGQLAESIAALVEHQRRRIRGLNLNSFVAYVVFTMLCGGAFYFLYQSRARELAVARDRALTERDAADHRATEAAGKLAGRDAADAKAWDAWQLFDAGKRDVAAQRVAELAGAPLSRLDRDVLAARAKQAAGAQTDATLKAAAAAFKAGRYGEVIASVERALEGGGPRAPELHYLAGVAHARGGELAKAIAHLQAAVDGEVADEDARFQLASALDRDGQWGKARPEYDRFATAHPQSPFAAFAMRRSAALDRLPAVAPAASPSPAAKPAPPVDKPPAGSAAPAAPVAPTQ